MTTLSSRKNCLRSPGRGPGLSCHAAHHVHVCLLSLFSRALLFVTLWTGAHQAPLSMGFFRYKDWSGFLAFLQGIFLIQGLNPRLLCLLHWQAGSLPLEPHGKPSSPYYVAIIYLQDLLIHHHIDLSQPGMVSLN